MVNNSVQQKWILIKEESNKYDGVSKNFNPEESPDWYDNAKFKQAQQSVLKYYQGFLFGILTGFLFGVHKLEVFLPISYTGQSATVQKLFRRYISTINHITLWTESDPFDKNSECFKSLKMVRSFHRNVGKNMNEKGGRVEGRDELWASQYSMVHGQFALGGFITVYPKQCGLHNINKQDFEGLLYFWRVVGYCIGIEDKYNLFSGTAEEVVHLSKRLFDEEWYPNIKTEPVFNPAGEHMSKGICTALCSVMKFIKWNVLMRYWCPILNIKRTIELESISDKIWFYLLTFILTFVVKYRLLRNLFNSLTHFRFFIANRFRNYFYENLKINYKHLTYEFPVDCPLSPKFSDNNNLSSKYN